MKKNIIKFLIPYLSLILLLIVLLSSFLPKIDNSDLYSKLHQETNVLNYFNQETVDQKSIELIGFFENKNQLDTNFYNEDEINHLEDVKRIFGFLKIFLLFLGISFVAGIYYLYKQKNLSQSLSCILLIQLITAFSLFILFYLIPFDTLFELMHKFFFPQGNYSFDPASSNMIRLFPGEFFSGFFENITITLIFYESLVLISWVSLIIAKKYKITFK